MILVSALSVLLQFIAAYLSIRMIRITGKRRAWILITAAITIAALRRSYDLYRFIFGNTGNLPSTTGELFSFLTSICMVIGVAYIAPLFLSIKRSEESLRKSEEALLEQQNFTSSLIQSSASATFVLDKTHRIIIWNKACEELTGCQQSDMIGTNDQWKPFCRKRMPTVADLILDGAPGHSSLPGNNYSRSSLNPHGVRAEGWYENLGGKDRYIVFEASPVYNINGELIAAIETLQDITESKKVEIQLMQSQKMEAVGRLAGGIAHDFNNLLTPIIGYSDLVLTELPETHFAKDKIRVVRDTGCKAADLVKQLLAFSRKQVLEMKPVNLNEIVLNMSRIFERTIGEDIELELCINNPVKNVSADAGQIEQVLMNLVLNARDAMPGGGRLTIETADVYLDETCELIHSKLVNPGQYVTLSVSDTGMGMSREIMEMIFDPFFTTKEAGKGTGLGLATTYGIIEQHNGYMWTYSEPGMGTAFKVYLPAIEEDVKPIKQCRPTIAIGGTETILVVDDEPLVRDFVVDVLRHLGYKVLEASCAKEALKICGNNQGKIDILLTDLVMPGMNGQECAAIFKEKRPESKVIFMSGYREKFISDSDLSTPKELFVQKPIIVEKLTVTIREALGS
ncbi:MAG: ATP-binding protein [Dissulfurispiraceae bacterium]